MVCTCCITWVFSVSVPLETSGFEGVAAVHSRAASLTHGQLESEDCFSLVSSEVKYCEVELCMKYATQWTIRNCITTGLIPSLNSKSQAIKVYWKLHHGVLMR